MDKNEFRIGAFLVEPNLDRLTALEDGRRRIEVEPKTMAVLMALAARPGEVVASEDLIRDVWQGRPMGDNPVYKAITKLRHAFNDDAEAPRFIETIPRKGYRLIAPIEARGPSEPPADVTPTATPRSPTPGSRTLLRVAVLATVFVMVLITMNYQRQPTAAVTNAAPLLASGTSVPVVLAPFDDGGSGLGPTLDSGLRERIAAIPSVSLSQPSATLPSRGLVFAGSLVQGKSGLLVTMRVDGDGVRDIWHRDLEVDAKDPAKILDVAAGAIQDLSRQRVRSLQSTAPDFTTLQLYLIARSILRERPRGFAAQLHRRSDELIQRAPDFSQGHALRSIACHFEIVYSGPGPDDQLWSCMTSSAEKALQLGPDVAEAYAAAGFTENLQADRCRYEHCDEGKLLEAAQMHLERAVRLDPQLLEARIWLAVLFGSRMQLTRAHEQSLAALKLDPLSPIAAYNVADDLLSQGHYGEAGDILGPVLGRPGALPQGYQLLALAARDTGNPEESLKWARAGLVAWREHAQPGLEGYVVLPAAETLARFGQPAEARRALAEFPVDRTSPEDTTLVPMRNWAHVWLGERAAIRPYLEGQMHMLSALPPEVRRFWNRPVRDAVATGYALLGDPDSVIRVLEPVHPPNTPTSLDTTDFYNEIAALQSLAWAYRQRGNPGRAREVIAVAQDWMANVESQGFGGNSYFKLGHALGYVLADQMPQARAEVKRAIAIGWPSAGDIELDPTWGDARQDPQIKALLAGLHR